MAKTDPPQASELEFSLFGPGIGECVVVHLGIGNWMIVDSCLDETGETSVALQYLHALGVDVGKQVKLIVATHWHDDHIRGISQVVQHASSARFACSAALRSEEFCTLLAAGDQIKLVEHTSGVSEFAYILELLQARSGGLYMCGPDDWVAAGTLLYAATTPYNVEVHGLSPSSQTITDSKGQIAKLIPSLRGAIRRLPTIGPNDMSVAILVKTSGASLLLGADLETGQDSRRGWRAVLGSSVRPHVTSSVYKVAHHGSVNAELDGIWTQLLVADVRAALTPYARGSNPLPSVDDIGRIRSRTRHLYCTTYPPTKRPPPRRGVDRTMNQIARTRRVIQKCPGHVRVRAPISGDLDRLSVELFDGAVQL